MNAGMAYSAHKGQDNRSGLGMKLQAPVLKSVGQPVIYRVGFVLTDTSN